MQDECVSQDNLLRRSDNYLLLLCCARSAHVVFGDGRMTMTYTILPTLMQKDELQRQSNLQLSSTLH
jgi:hypothetical protein